MRTKSSIQRQFREVMIDLLHLDRLTSEGGETVLGKIRQRGVAAFAALDLEPSVRAGEHREVTLALLGQYTAASFTLASDGHGGTLVFDPPAGNASPLLVASHHG